MKEWNWFEKSGMINSEYMVNDGLSSSCQNNQQTIWTYNQGVILGGLVTLSAQTRNVTLITIAKNISNAAIKKLTYSNGVLKEPCEPNCGSDAPQFKGIFVRYLGILANSLPSTDPSRTTYIDWLKLNADSISSKDKTAQNLCGLVWIGPANTLGASEQTSAIDCFNALTLLGQ